MEQVKKLVSGVQSSFAEISTVAEVINQLAKHTNLQALNANIEANEAKQAIKVGQPYAHVDDRGIARAFHPIHTGSSEKPWSLMVTFDTAAALTA